MRRLVTALVVALAALVGVSSPASAHGTCNWSCPNSVDNLEVSDYVDMYAAIVWQVGATSMRPCPNYEEAMTFTSHRPGGHYLRLQYISAATGFVAWDITRYVGAYATVFIQPPPSWITYTSEPYLKAWWGDSGYPARELDHFWNWAGDTNDVHSLGYYC